MRLFCASSAGRARLRADPPRRSQGVRTRRRPKIHNERAGNSVAQLGGNSVFPSPDRDMCYRRVFTTESAARAAEAFREKYRVKITAAPDPSNAAPNNTRTSACNPVARPHVSSHMTNNMRTQSHASAWPPGRFLVHHLSILQELLHPGLRDACRERTLCALRLCADDLDEGLREHRGRAGLVRQVSLAFAGNERGQV